MRRLFYIFCTALLLPGLYSCENPLEYRPADKSDKLIVNALMDACDTLHFVQLGISKTSRVAEVSGAELKCFVNGVLAAQTADLQEGRLSFKADFQAGDRLRLEVKADGRFSASAEMTVPGQPVIKNVRTEKVSRMEFEDDSATTYIRFNIELQDPGSGDGCYSVKIGENYILCTGSTLLQPEVMEDEIDAEGETSISVSSLSLQHYYYLKALEYISDDGSDFSLEGVSIPDNISGGIGFAGVSNSSVTDVTP